MTERLVRVATRDLPRHHQFFSMPCLIRTILIAAFAILAAACSPADPSADIRRCIAEAQRNTSPTPGADAEEAHDQLGSLVADCMRDAGYRHDMSSAQCLDDVDFNPACYVRRRLGVKHSTSLMPQSI